MKTLITTLTLAAMTGCSIGPTLNAHNECGYMSDVDCIEHLMRVEKANADFQRRADAEVARHAKVMARAMAAALEEDRKAKAQDAGK